MRAPLEYRPHPCLNNGISNVVERASHHQLDPRSPIHAMPCHALPCLQPSLCRCPHPGQVLENERLGANGPWQLGESEADGRVHLLLQMGSGRTLLCSPNSLVDPAETKRRHGRLDLDSLPP